MKNCKRNSNIELLRIVLMSFVITLHYNGMGGHALEMYTSGVNFYFTRFTEAFGICAVDCFVLISGFFLSYNRKIKVKKILHILIVVIGLKFFDFLFQILIDGNNFSLRSFVACFLPTNYYATFYLVLYVLSPFVSKLFDSFKDKKQTALFIGILIFLFSLFPFCLEFANHILGLNVGGMNTVNAFTGSESGYTIVNFLLLYCVGVFISRYKISIKNVYSLTGYLLSLIFIFVLEFIDSSSALSYASPFVILNAVCLFMLFSKITFTSKVVNYVSAATFGVFCLNTGNFFGTKWSLFEIPALKNSRGGVLLNSLFVVFAMTAVSYGIDLVLSLLVSPLRKKLNETRLYKKEFVVE